MKPAESTPARETATVVRLKRNGVNHLIRDGKRETVCGLPTLDMLSENSKRLCVQCRRIAENMLWKWFRIQMGQDTP